jgi:hypothetical protein
VTLVKRIEPPLMEEKNHGGLSYGVVNQSDPRRKLAAVRAYFQQTFPGTDVRDSYDPQLLAQVFRIKTDQAGGFRNAVVFTVLLDDYTPNQNCKAVDLKLPRR